MAFTDNCDLFVSVNERGMNRVATHIRRQRPSLFNYASAAIAANPELWCTKVDISPEVTKHHNPIFTIESPIPVLGSAFPPVGLNFCAQLAAAEIDLHPSNVFALPAELGSKLAPQHLAFHVRICAAVDCPGSFINKLPIGPFDTPAEGRVLPPPVVPQTLKLECVCLDVFVTAHFEVRHNGTAWALTGVVDDVDIVDIKPDALEDNICCYIKTTAAVLLRQRLALRLPTAMLDLPLFNLATIVVSPSPNPPVPNNPAVEDDQVKLFVDVTVLP